MKPWRAKDFDDLVRIEPRRTALTQPSLRPASHFRVTQYRRVPGRTLWPLECLLGLLPQSRRQMHSPEVLGTQRRENELRAVEFAQKKMEQWYLAAGAIQVVRRPMSPPGVSTH